MIIITIGRKALLIAIAAVLLCSMGFNIYSGVRNIKIRNTYESIICIANQYGGLELISFISPAVSDAPGDQSVEIFDINQGKVVKNIQTVPEIQSIVEGYLNGITGMYGKVKAFPDRGFIIKVPFNPHIKVKNHWLSDFGINSVDKAYILFPEKEKPYLLVLDEKGRPLFFNFSSDTDLLLEKLDITRTAEK